VGGELTANADGFLVGIAGSAAADALVMRRSGNGSFESHVQRRR